MINLNPLKTFLKKHHKVLDRLIEGLRWFLSAVGLAGMGWSITSILAQARGVGTPIELKPDAHNSLENRHDLLNQEYASSAAEIAVSIGGGVVTPGVYQLPKGSRIVDVIAAAKGFSEQADLFEIGRSLNLAKTVQDSEHLYIAVRGVKPADSPASSKDEKDSGSMNNDSLGGSRAQNLGIDWVNKASKQDLMSISGIGETYASRIIELRPYNSWDELRENAKISSRLVEKVREKSEL